MAPNTSGSGDLDLSSYARTIETPRHPPGFRDYKALLAPSGHASVVYEDTQSTRSQLTNDSQSMFSLSTSTKLSPAGAANRLNTRARH